MSDIVKIRVSILVILPNFRGFNGILIFAIDLL